MSCAVRKGLFLLVFWFFASAVALPQVPTPKPTPADEDDEVVTVDTELVDVPITVRDRTGRPVLGLKSSNFVVFEDGKPQKIEEFSTTTAPLEITLLLDTSGSARAELEVIRRAAQHFVDSLRPGDRVAIVAFRTEMATERTRALPEILTRLTGDRERLRSALANIGTSNGTPYYDAMIEVAETIFADAPEDDYRGRRAIVALTDGVDSTSAAGFDEAREMIDSTGAAVFFIRVDTRPFFEENLMGDCQTAIRFSQSQIRRYYAGFDPKANVEKTFDFCKLGEFERLAISKKIYELADSEMSQMAKASGGRVFEAAALSEARNAFRQVAAEMGTRYSIGYYSTNEKRDGTYRRIKVDLKGVPTGAEVRAREGYIARRP